MGVNYQIHTSPSLAGDKAPSTQYAEVYVDPRAKLMQWREEKSLHSQKSNPCFQLML
jgi:hypothetical protein